MPFAEKVAYGSGAFAEVVQVNAIKQLANPVLNLQLGLNPGLVGLLLAIPRLWDAFIDLAVGNLSDRTQSRWGRRKPFILFGGIASAICFVLLWCIPVGLGQFGTFTYFLIGSLVFYLAYAHFIVPWTALGFELSEGYEDRTALMSVRTLIINVSGFLPPWLLALTQLPMFSSTLEGARYCSLTIAALVVAASVIVVVFVKERPTPVCVKQKKHMAFLPSFVNTMGNIPFLMLVTIVILMLTAVVVEGSLGLYINIYHVHHGRISSAATWNGILGTLYNVLGLVTVFIVPSFARRLDKHLTLFLFLVMAFFGAMLRWICYTPNHPFLMLIPTLLIAPSMTAMWILVNSMIADLCDIDEVRVGQRREGMFSAVYGWIVKLGLSLAYLLGGYALVFSGFDATAGLDQAPTALFCMRMIFTVFPSIALLLAGILAFFYPVRRRHVLAAAETLAHRT